MLVNQSAYIRSKFLKFIMQMFIRQALFLKAKVELTRRKELLFLTISLVPKWSCSEWAIPFEEALEIIKVTVKRGRWHPSVDLKLGMSKETYASRTLFKSCPKFLNKKMSWKKLYATLRVNSKAVSQYYECRGIGHLAKECPAHRRRSGKTQNSPGKGNLCKRSRSQI
jgi:hypothetical protein